MKRKEKKRKEKKRKEKKKEQKNKHEKLFSRVNEAFTIPESYMKVIF